MQSPTDQHLKTPEKSKTFENTYQYYKSRQDQSKSSQAHLDDTPQTLNLGTTKAFLDEDSPQADTFKRQAIETSAIKNELRESRETIVRQRNIERELHREIEELKKKHEEALVRQRQAAELEQDLMKQKFLSLSADYNKKVARMNEDYDRLEMGYATDQESLRAELKESQNLNIMLTASKTDDHNSMVLSLKQMADQLKAHKESYDKLQAEYQRENEEWLLVRDQLTKSLAGAQDLIRDKEQTEKELQHRLLLQEQAFKQLRESHEQAIAQLKLEQVNHAQVVAAHANELSRLQKENVERHQRQMEEQKLTLNHAFEMRLEQEMIRIRLEHETEMKSKLEALGHEHAAAIANKDSQHRQELQKLHAEHEAAILVAKQQHEHLFQQERQAHQLEDSHMLDDLKKTHEDALHRQQLELEAVLHVKLEAMQSEHESQKAHQAELQQSELTKLRHDHDVILKSKLEALEHQHAAAIAVMESEHKRALQASHLEARNQLERLQQEHAQSVHQLQSSLQSADFQKLSLEYSRRNEKLIEDFDKVEAAYQAEIESMQKSLQDCQDELLRCNTLHEEQHRTLQAQLKQASDEYQSHRESCSKMHAEILHVKAQLQEELHQRERLTKTLEEAHLMINHKDQIEATMQKQLLEKDRIIHEMQIAHETQMMQLKVVSDASIQRMRQEHETEMKSKLEALGHEHAAAISNKDSQHRQELQKLHAEHEAAILVAKQQHEHFFQQERQAHQLEDSHMFDDLKKTHEDALHRQQLELEAVLHVKLEAMQSEHESQKAHQAELQQSELTKLRHDHDVILKSKLEALEHQHAAAIAVMESEHKLTIHNCRVDFENTIQTLRLEHDNQLVKLNTTQYLEKSAFAQKLADLSRSHDDATHKLQQEHEAIIHVRLEAAQKQHDQLMAHKDELHQKELNQLRIEVQEAIKNHDESKHAHEIKLQELRACQELAIASALEKQKHEHDELTAHQATLHEQALHQLRSEHDFMLNQHIAFSDSAHSKVFAAKAIEQEDALQKLRTELQATLRDRLEQQQREHEQLLLRKDEERSHEMTNLRCEHEKECQEQQHSHARSLAAKEQEHARILQDLADSHQTALCHLNQKHSDSIEELKSSLCTQDFAKFQHLHQEYDQKVAKMTEDFDKLEAVYTLEIQTNNQSLQECKDEHLRYKSQKEEELNALHAQLKTVTEQLRNHKESEVHAAEEKRRLEEQLAHQQTRIKEYVDEVCKLKADHEHMRDTHAQEISQIHRTSEYNLQKQLADRKQQYEEVELAKLHSQHASVIAQLKQEHETNVREKLKELQREHELALDKMKLDDDRNKLKAELLITETAIKLAELEQKAEQLQTLEAKHHQELERLRREHESALLAKTTELYNFRLEHETAFQKQRMDHDDAVRQARNENLSANEALAAKLAMTLQTHNEDIHRLKQEHEAAVKAELEKQQRDHERALAAKNTDHEHQLNNLRCECDDKLAKLAILHEQEQEQIRIDHSAAIKFHQEAQDKARDQITAKELAEYQANLQKILSDHKAEILHLKQEHDEAVVAIKQLQDSSTTQLKKAHDDEMERMKLQHQQELIQKLADQKSLHEKGLEQLRIDHAAIVKQHQQESLKSHDQVKAAVLAEYETNLQKIRSNHDDEMTLLKLEHQKAFLSSKTMQDSLTASIIKEHEEKRELEVKQLQLELIQKLADQKSLHEKELQQLQIDHAAVIKQHQEGALSAYNKVSDGQRAEFEHELLKARTEHSAAIEKMKHEHDEQIKRQVGLHEMEKAALMKKHEDVYSSHQHFVSELQAEHAKMLQESLDAQRRERDAFYLNLREEEKQRADSERSKLTCEHDVVLEAEKQARATAEAAVAKKEQAMQALKREHDLALVKVKKEYENQVERINLEHEVLLTENAIKLAELEQKAEQLQTLEAKHHQELERLRHEHQSALNKNQSDHQQVLRKFRIDHETAIQKQQQDRDDAVRQARNENSSANEALAAKLAMTLQTHNEDIHRLKQEHEAAVKAELEKQQRDHERALAAKNTDHEQKTEELRQTLVQWQKVQFEDYTKKHADSLAKISQDNENTLRDRLNKAEQGFQLKLDTELTKHKAAMEVLTNQHKQQTEALIKTNQQQAGEIEKLKAEFQNEKLSTSMMVKMLTTANEQESQELKKARNRVMQLTTENEALKDASQKRQNGHNQHSDWFAPCEQCSENRTLNDTIADLKRRLEQKEAAVAQLLDKKYTQ